MKAMAMHHVIQVCGRNQFLYDANWPNRECDKKPKKNISFAVIDYQPICQYNEDCPPTKLCDRLNRRCINPCLVDSCGLNAECTPFNHGIECRCLDGFVGNPYIECSHLQGCRSDSECSSSEACVNGQCGSPCKCGANALCDVIDHRPICLCPNGYTGDAIIGCAPPSNPCDPNPCGVNAFCELDRGNPICFCPKGLTGNPFKNCSKLIRFLLSSPFIPFPIILLIYRFSFSKLKFQKVTNATRIHADQIVVVASSMTHRSASVCQNSRELHRWHRVKYRQIHAIHRRAVLTHSARAWVTDLLSVHVCTATSKARIRFVVAWSQEIHANQTHAVMVHRAMSHEIQFASAPKVSSAIHSANAICRQSCPNCVVQDRVAKMPTVMCQTIVNNASVVQVSWAIRTSDVANKHVLHANQIHADQMLNASSQQMDTVYADAQTVWAAIQRALAAAETMNVTSTKNAQLTKLALAIGVAIHAPDLVALVHCAKWKNTIRFASARMAWPAIHWYVATWPTKRIVHRAHQVHAVSTLNAMYWAIVPSARAYRAIWAIHRVDAIPNAWSIQIVPAIRHASIHVARNLARRPLVASMPNVVSSITPQIATVAADTWAMHSSSVYRFRQLQIHRQHRANRRHVASATRATCTVMVLLFVIHAPTRTATIVPAVGQNVYGTPIVNSAEPAWDNDVLIHARGHAAKMHCAQSSITIRFVRVRMVCKAIHSSTVQCRWRHRAMFPLRAIRSNADRIRSAVNKTESWPVFVRVVTLEIRWSAAVQNALSIPTVRWIVRARTWSAWIRASVPVALVPNVKSSTISLCAIVQPTTLATH